MQQPQGFDVKLYFSGSVDHEVSDTLLAYNVHRLFTYAYPKEVFEYLNRANELGVRCTIMNDSGAFTAWSIGKPVQLEELLAYNKRIISDYGDRHNFVFIALDVIPGERGRRATQQEIDAAEEQSKQNFVVMQQELAPYKVLPVYHSGEHVRLRNWYQDRTDYICLSMDQGMSEINRLNWAKRAAVDGYMYHGLAATGNRMVTQIGWYSVDSSSWVTVGSMGNILWPVDGQFRTLAVSESSPMRHEAGHHIKTLTPVETEMVKDYIVRSGFDPETLASDYRQRWRWNIMQWVYAPWRRNIQKPMDLFESC